MSGAWTGIELWVADAGIGVGFFRYDEKAVLAWCRKRGFRILEDTTSAQRYRDKKTTARPCAVAL